MKRWSVEFDVSANFEFFVKARDVQAAERKLRKLVESGDLSIKIYPEGVQREHFLIDEDCTSLVTAVIIQTNEEKEADW